MKHQRKCCLQRRRQQERHKSNRLHLQHAFYFCSFLCRNCTITATWKRTQHFWPTTPNIVESCWVRLLIAKSLRGFKLCATTPNNRQWLETGFANVRNIYHSTILGVVGQKCCVCLHRALRRKYRCLISRFMVDANKYRRNLLSLSEIRYRFLGIKLQLSSPTFDQESELE